MMNNKLRIIATGLAGGVTFEGTLALYRPRGPVVLRIEALIPWHVGATEPALIMFTIQKDSAPTLPCQFGRWNRELYSTTAPASYPGAAILESGGTLCEAFRLAAVQRSTDILIAPIDGATNCRASRNTVDFTGLDGERKQTNGAEFRDAPSSRNAGIPARTGTIELQSRFKGNLAYGAELRHIPMITYAR